MDNFYFMITSTIFIMLWLIKIARFGYKDLDVDGIALLFAVFVVNVLELYMLLGSL